MGGLIYEGITDDPRTRLDLHIIPIFSVFILGRPHYRYPPRVYTRAHTPRDSRERLAASSLVTIRRRVSRESQRRQRNSFAEANCSSTSSSSLYPWRASRIKRPWRVTFSNTFTNAPSRFPLVASMRLLFLLRSSKPHDRLFPFDPTAHEDAVINQTVLKVER